LGKLAQAGFGTVDHVEDHLQRAIRSADIAWPQTEIHRVTGFAMEVTTGP
jgi:hypothetical protein